MIMFYRQPLLFVLLGPYFEIVYMLYSALADFLVAIASHGRGKTYVANVTFNIILLQRQQSVASEVTLGSWRTLRRGTSLWTKYSLCIAGKASM